MLLLVLIALVAMRSVWIDTPCAGAHAWRQADTLAVARNYLTEDAPFLLPRIDRRGDLTGICGCEFPALNYFVAVAYRMCGLHEWVGRAVVLLISILASLCLHAHVRQRSGSSVALIAVLLMNSAPAYFYYSRCVMPDTVAVAAMLGSLWAFGRWLACDRASWLAGSAVAAAFALLVKPSAGILLFGFAFCLLRRDGLGVLRQVRLWLWTAAILLPFLWWYGVHVPWLNEQYGLELSDEDYTTIGGYVFGALGRLPLVGDRVSAGGATFDVREMDGRRIKVLAMTIDGVRQAEKR